MSKTTNKDPGSFNDYLYTIKSPANTKITLSFLEFVVE